MLRFVACGLIALSVGLMVGATLAATLPADEPTAAMFQRPDRVTLPATTALSEPDHARI